ncbi:MAG: sulfatase-like hydrolase/transferase [Tunicatimonas sp.]|uniref:sulfatase-like hydrolase/transferase n=1 Tax=Tunicatimonas sp. TaxID=1940096 RepID=UPI003C76A190
MVNHFFLVLFALSSVLIQFGCSPTDEEPDQPSLPNIVFLFADDMTYTAIHALGNTEIATPNLDRLVRDGTTFTHTYNMGGWNGAVCIASRSMMISGRSLWRANQFKDQWQQNDSLALAQTWGNLMEQQGYNTYLTGKWHVAANPDSVFQAVRHVRPGMPGDFRSQGSFDRPETMPLGYNRPKNEQDTSWSPYDTAMGGFWEGGQHWSEVLRDDALDFLDSATAKPEPFFMYLAFNAPHDPRQAPKEYVDRYPLDSISLPESWMPRYPYDEDIGLGAKLRDEALAPFPRTEYATRIHTQEYYAIITHLDEQVGKILDALEASGKMEDTYVFFSADHGLSVGRHGLLGKQNMYDHSVRVPLMLVGPKIPANQRIDADVYLQDVMATSLELANISKPNYVEFTSLLNLAQGRTDTGAYEAIYGAYINYQRMIRKDGMKLIVYPDINQVLLYDLQQDPHETTNLADDPAYADQVASLFQDLQALQQQYADTLNLEPTYQQLQSQL